MLELDDFEALFVTFAFYIAYTVMAFPMAFVLQKSGYKNGMAIGLGVMAIGSLLFIPAATNVSFILFLVALFTLGTGLTILQTASNPYIVLLGPVESAAMRISIMGLVNKSAGVIVPLMFTAYILSSLGSLEMVKAEVLADKLVMPYIIMAVVLSLLILLVKFSALPELEYKDTKEQKGSIFAFPKVILGAIALFFYVGIEVIAGDTIGLYAQNIGLKDATSLTSYTMVFMVIGYIIGVSSIPKYISQQKALVFSALLGIIFIFGIVFSSSKTDTLSSILWGWSGIATLPDTITFVALLGLSNALIWPTIWPLALDGLGIHTPKGSALLIMAIAGGAILPLVFGKIAQISGDMQSAYMFGIISYLFILFFGVRGYKMSSWKR
jgi:glucose/galactose transporter